MKLEKGIAYRCKTEAIAKAFLEDAERLGWKWLCDGEKPTDNSHSFVYDIYFDDTCYMYSSVLNGLCYGEKSSFEFDNIKVVEYILEEVRED